MMGARGWRTGGWGVSVRKDRVSVFQGVTVLKVDRTIIYSPR